MRRLITSRGVRFAFAFGAAAMVVVVIVARLRRRPADQDPPGHDGPPAGAPARVGTGTQARAGTEPPSPDRAEAPAEAGGGPVPPWPPVPVLGVPAAKDFERYDTGTSALRSAVEGFFTRAPREPLDEATLRRLRRWGAAGLAFLLLLGGAQALDAAVFSQGTRFESSHLYEDGSCFEGVRVDPPAFNVCMDVESEADAFTGSLPVPDPVTPEAFPETPGPTPREPDPGPSVDADCRPAATPRVRPVDPRVTRAVNRQWRRIETWLEANAPESRRTLGEPARARTIAVAEAQMGVRFPDSLRASLLRHDGSFSSRDTRAFGFQGDANLSVREIRDTWRMLCEIDSHDDIGADPSDPRSEWWDGRMIPISADGTGNHLMIDSVRRDVGQTDHEGSMRFTVGGMRIRSYHALLKATADALETGGSVGYMRPGVVGGELEWGVDELSPFANAGVPASS